MLNTDGLGVEDNNGCGGIIRSHEGKVRLLFHGNGGCDSVIEQELIAIQVRFGEVKEMDIDKIYVVPDSLLNVNMVAGTIKPSWYG